MAGIRDDSAGPYGQWTNDPNQSWGDYLKMLGMDAGEGAYNALANITGGLSPIGTSPEGNMALQVPPMVSGLYDSAKRIGERGGFTRVEEFDAPLKQDLANALLTFYGGNALAGVAKPRGALGAGAMREAGGVSVSGQHPNYQIMNEGSPVGRAYVREYPETIQLGQLHVDPEFQRQGIATEAQRLLAQQYGKPTVPDVNLSQSELARWQKNDPAAVADYAPYFEGASSYMPLQGSDAYRASQGSGVVPGTRASRGELFSRPVPLHPQQDDNLPDWLKF